MRLLLDTHAFLWFITADPKLSSTAEREIRRSGNTPLLSVASVWEIAIKVNLGRLPIPRPLDTFIPEQLRINRIHLLPVELHHTFEIARLPLHHRDPFDRLLLAQVISEGIPMVSADSAFDAYSIQRVW
ncbi:MAG TPA: type II toxin-antitoxin system VapC family toxin [Longimicrobiaceae bacterium]|nr:type II toxin-antitoxin system VapC family toxin [Longimicrobiaceae bacterium]